MFMDSVINTFTKHAPSSSYQTLTFQQSIITIKTFFQLKDRYD